MMMRPTQSPYVMAAAQPKVFSIPSPQAYPQAAAPAAGEDPVIYINQDSTIPGQTFRLLSRARPIRSPGASPYAAQFPGMEGVAFDQYSGQYSAVPPFPGVPQPGFVDPFPYSQPPGGYDQQQQQQQQGYGQQQQQYDQSQYGGQAAAMAGGNYDIPPEQQGGEHHLSYAEKDKKARTVFKKYDKDGNGFLDIYEFLQAMNHLGADLTYGDAQGLFAVFDESQQNCITIDQFASNFCANY